MLLDLQSSPMISTKLMDKVRKAVLDLAFLDLQFGGLLSGLYEQTEITDLLDELYYEVLRR